MQEFEIKFQVPRERLAGLEAELMSLPGSSRLRLRAHYHDTPGRHLARAGIALRARQEGRRRVQTLKAAGEDVLSRFEHELPLSAGMEVDPARHAGTSGGERLLAALASAGEPLGEVFRTDIWRRRAVLDTAAGRVELALDAGRIVSGRRDRPVAELEIELLDGSAGAVLETARTWVARHGLWLDVRSKAERGDRLARGLEHVDAVRAEPVPHQGPPAARWREVLRGAVAHLLPNVAELCEDDAHPQSAGQVHQVRVALRHLRTSLKAFRDWPGAPDRERGVVLSQRAATVFRALGGRRDQDVMDGLLAPVLQEAGLPPVAWLRSVAPEATGRAPGDTQAASGAFPEGASAGAVLRSPLAQELFLDLLELLHADEPASGPWTAEDARAFAARRLKRWHREVAGIGPPEDLDEAAMHDLRKRIKRLRYAVEDLAPLCAGSGLKRYRRALAHAQDAFGRYNDAVTALARLQAGADSASAWYARGWLSGRLDGWRRDCEAALQALAESPKFWKA